MAPNETTQNKLATLLAKAGIPHKQIKCYGRQIEITCWSRKAAERFQSLLGMTNGAYTDFAIVETIDVNLKNKKDFLNPSSHTVYRFFARVA